MAKPDRTSTFVDLATSNLTWNEVRMIYLLDAWLRRYRQAGTTAYCLSKTTSYNKLLLHEMAAARNQQQQAFIIMTLSHASTGVFCSILSAQYMSDFVLPRILHISLYRSIGGHCVQNLSHRQGIGTHRRDAIRQLWYSGILLAAPEPF